MKHIRFCRISVIGQFMGMTLLGSAKICSGLSIVLGRPFRREQRLHFRNVSFSQSLLKIL